MWATDKKLVKCSDTLCTSHAFIQLITFTIVSNFPITTKSLKCLQRQYNLDEAFFSGRTALHGTGYPKSQLEIHIRYVLVIATEDIAQEYLYRLSANTAASSCRIPQDSRFSGAQISSMPKPESTDTIRAFFMRQQSPKPKK